MENRRIMLSQLQIQILIKQKYDLKGLKTRSNWYVLGI